jgi:hypothetical protein
MKYFESKYIQRLRENTMLIAGLLVGGLAGIVARLL